MRSQPQSGGQRLGRSIPWVGLALASLFLTACGVSSVTVENQDPDLTDPTKVVLEFTYGSEKEEWLKDVTEEFNKANHKVAGGKTIKVKAVPKGSGESIDDLLAGRSKAHLTSPASGAFITLGNAESKAKTGKELVGPTKNLVMSPAVIAMWKPMAEALGWPDKPVGWADVRKISSDPKGWESFNYPQWGKFKFGHTHPEHSNSGLISVMAELYAGAGKTADLTVEDLAKPEVAKFVEDIERSIVHYGSSTGFFGRKMFENGPQYLSAAVLYENMIIESYSPKYKDLPFPVVAIYPKEGTFWSDHPVGIVQREWVTPEHQEAAKLYIDFLLKAEQQQKALKYGFRPGLENVPLAAPLDKAHGIDPEQPKVTLQVPSAEVMKAGLEHWQKYKKHTQVLLVFDTSGSMRAGGKMTNAQLGAQQLLTLLGDQDEFAMVTFSDKPGIAEKGVRLDKGRENAKKMVQGLFPNGETALYDAVLMGYQHIQDNPRPEMIQAVVVLTDGADNKSKLKLDELLEKIKIDYERRPTRVFTIAYGADANKDILKRIADATQARSYEGTAENIRAILREIATFF